MPDFFIGHTAEDKPTATALADALQAHQFDVVYENTVLHMGDSLSEDLRQFFSMARCGVLLLSRSFFNMLWSQWELDEMVAMVEKRTNARLMTVLHGLSEDEVARYSPLLAGKASISTAVGLTTVAETLAQMMSQNLSGSTGSTPATPSFTLSGTNKPVEANNIGNDNFSKGFNFAPSLTLRSGHMPQLGDQLATQFSEPEIRDICFELGLNYSQLAGESKNEKSHALLKELHRRGEVGALLQLVSQLRPAVSWM